jgi:hypothetical protein
MIFDLTNKFSSDQSVTATAASENVIDLGVSGRDIGVGEVVPLRIAVTEDFATLTSLQVSVQTSDTEGSGYTDVILTPAIAAASLVDGYVFNIQSVPRGVLGRYVRLNYTVTGSDATAGKINAGITMGNQDNG